MTMPPCKDTTNELLVNAVGLKQQLDRTKKKLDIAVDALKELKENAFLSEYAESVINKALEQINQKEEQ